MENPAANKYLNELYLKSKSNFRKGYDMGLLGKLIGADKSSTQNIVHYLSGKKYVDTTSGFGENILITSDGIDYIEKQRKGKTFTTIKFTNAELLQPASRSGHGYLYFYTLSTDAGAVESKAISVFASDILAAQWNLSFYNNGNAEKILLQFAKNSITQKLKEGTLTNHEEVDLLTGNQPRLCPYSPENLASTKETEFEIETGGKLLAEELNENKLAALIIEWRDRINAVFGKEHGENLLLLNQERNLLDFFKTAASEEEFSFRLNSLAEVARNFNVPLLRKLTGEKDTTVRSVGLLDKYLITLKSSDKSIVDTLRQIGKIRQGYPTHKDLPDVIKGYEYFGIKYPLEKFNDAWLILLNKYVDALKKLFEIFTED